MIAADVKVSGPLFEPDLARRLLAANLEAGLEVAPKIGAALSRNYAGGIVGPGKPRPRYDYGRLSAQIRHAVQISGDTVAVRVMPQGKASFKALFLEKGRRRTGLYHIQPTDKRDRLVRRARGHAAALRTPWGYRRRVAPSTMPAFRVAERTLEQQQAGAFEAFRTRVASVMGAA